MYNLFQCNEIGNLVLPSCYFLNQLFKWCIMLHSIYVRKSYIDLLMVVIIVTLSDEYFMQNLRRKQTQCLSVRKNGSTVRKKSRWSESFGKKEDILVLMVLLHLFNILCLKLFSKHNFIFWIKRYEDRHTLWDSHSVAE